MSSEYDKLSTIKLFPATKKKLVAKQAKMSVKPSLAKLANAAMMKGVGLV